MPSKRPLKDAQWVIDVQLEANGLATNKFRLAYADSFALQNPQQMATLIQGRIAQEIEKRFPEKKPQL